MLPFVVKPVGGPARLIVNDHKSPPVKMCFHGLFGTFDSSLNTLPNIVEMSQRTITPNPPSTTTP